MKKIVFLFFVLSAISCGIDYDGETRLVVSSRIVDSDGNPIANQKVGIYIAVDHYSDLVSEEITDTSGNLSQVFTAPRSSNAKIKIEILTNNLISRNYLNIEKKDFTDFKYTLNPITLYKADETVKLILDINRISGNKQIENIEIVGEVADNVYVNPVIAEEEFNTEYFTILRNSNYIIKYSIATTVNNQVTRENYSEAISSINDNIVHTITY